jgi:hypothetical protein
VLSKWLTRLVFASLPIVIFIAILAILKRPADPEYLEKTYQALIHDGTIPSTVSYQEWLKQQEPSEIQALASLDNAKNSYWRPLPPTEKIDYVEVEGNGRVVIYLTDGGYEYAQYSLWGCIQMTKGELWKISGSIAVPVVNSCWTNPGNSPTIKTANGKTHAIGRNFFNANLKAHIEKCP